MFISNIYLRYGAGVEGASRQDRLDSLLGKGGAGVQLYLQAEMCRGLQWRYSLVIAGCDAQNMPVKVVHPPHQSTFTSLDSGLHHMRITRLCL